MQPAYLQSHLPPELLQRPDGTSRLQRNFELLGAAIGDQEFVREHTDRRVQAIAPLLEALSSVANAQVGLRLLRSCASHDRIMHSVRCTPPDNHTAALQRFDSMVQATLSSITGLHLTADRQAQVGRALKFAGLGLRSATLDAPAAFLSSIGGGRAMACEEVDSAYTAGAVVLQPSVTRATATLNTMLANPLAPCAALSMKQKALTRLMDDASWSWDRRLSSSPPTRQALLRSEAEPGARAFLAAHGQVCHRTSPALGSAGCGCRRMVPTVPRHP